MTLIVIIHYLKTTVIMLSSISYLFSIHSMLPWVRRWLRDGISPSITVLSKWFFQVQSLQIILHNLVPSLVWSSLSCSTTNQHTSKFANRVLSFHPICVAKAPGVAFAAWPQKYLVFLAYYIFLQRFFAQTDATHSSSHLHICMLDSAGIFYLNQSCFTAI